MQKKAVLVGLVLACIGLVSAASVDLPDGYVLDYGKVSNTDKCLIDCSLKFWISLNKDYYIADDSWLRKAFIKFGDGYEIEQSGFRIYSGEEYTYRNLSAPVYGSVEHYLDCIGVQGVNYGILNGSHGWCNDSVCLSNETIIDKSVCYYIHNYERYTLEDYGVRYYWNTTEITGYENATGYRGTWNDFNPVGKTIKANETYYLELWGRRKPEIGNGASFINITIAGKPLTHLSWWNTTWNYRYNITVNNTAPIAHDYEILGFDVAGINLSTTVCGSYPNSTRVVWSKTNTLIDFERHDYFNYTIWVIFNYSLPAKSVNTSITIYCDNDSSHLDVSTTLFEFWDDFERGTYGPKWEPNGGLACAVETGDISGKYDVDCDSAEELRNNRTLNPWNINTSITNMWIIKWIKVDIDDVMTNIGQEGGTYELLDAQEDANAPVGFKFHSGGGYVVFYAQDPGTNYYLWNIFANGSTFECDAYINDVLRGNNQDCGRWERNTTYNSTIIGASTGDAGSMDDVFISSRDARGFMNESTITVGPLETTTTTSTTTTTTLSGSTTSTTLSFPGASRTMIYPVWYTIIGVASVFTLLAFMFGNPRTLILYPIAGFAWLIAAFSSASVSEVVVYANTNYLRDTYYPFLVTLFSLFGFGFLLSFIFRLFEYLKHKQEEVL